MSRARPFAAAALLLLLVGAFPAPAQDMIDVVDRPDLKRHFDAAGAVGTIVVEHAGSGKAVVYDAERAETGFLPASTFKIANALIALETGVATDADTQVWPWDGTTRPIEAWNRDHTLRSAFQASAVPVFQEIARRIGPERMQAAIERIGYGNGDLGGAPIDRFWLNGRLRISAWQQIAFLGRLREGDLPFSPGSLALVRDIMVVEKTPAYTLRAKSGWAEGTPDGRPGIGWWVGWVERGEDAHLFALNIDMATAAQAPAREAIVRAILHALGVL